MPRGPQRDPHPAELPDEELLKECTITRGRSTGPGGQHRNKVETKVMLRHDPTGAQAHAGERRSVSENRRVAIFRLRLNLATEIRHACPPGEQRTPLWIARCAEGKIRCNPEHRDYPALLAEAIDNLASCGWDVKGAAARLMVTPTQLVGLLRSHGPAMDVLNRQRKALGEHPLR